MPVAVPVLDNFNRADAATLGAAWTQEPLNDTASSLRIIGNQVYPPVSGYGYNWYNAASYSTASGTIECAIAIPTLGTGSQSAYWLSFLQAPSSSASTADGYECAVTVGTGKETELWRYDNAVATSLSSNTTDTFAAGSTLIVRLTAAGAFTMVKDVAGVETTILSATSTTYTGTFFIGLGIYDTSGVTRMDNFAAGILAAASAYVPRKTLLGVGR